MTLELELQALAVDIAREAGALAALRQAEGVQVAATKSTSADIVTAADREVEQLIRARLAAARPDDGFLGEESGTGGGTSGITWIVDPIDGTVNYAKGFAHYAVSIAAVTGVPRINEWAALAAVIYQPRLDECFRAAKGHGAYLGDAKLSVSEEGAAGALVATGFGYDPATHAGDLEALGRVMKHARDIRRMGSAALDLANIAAGRLDVYFERGLHAWDMAAGFLLVEEAGGRTIARDLAADRPQFIATNVDHFERIVAALN